MRDMQELSDILLKHLCLPTWVRILDWKHMRCRFSSNDSIIFRSDSISTELSFISCWSHIPHQRNFCNSDNSSVKLWNKKLVVWHFKKPQFLQKRCERKKQQNLFIIHPPLCFSFIYLTMPKQCLAASSDISRKGKRLSLYKSAITYLWEAAVEASFM